MQNITFKSFIAYGTLSILTINTILNLISHFTEKAQNTSPRTKNDFPLTKRDKETQTENSNSSIVKSELKRKLSQYPKVSNVFRIVLTGGPCSGKTTGVAFIAKKLREIGVRAFCVPEAATIIADGGGFINTFKLNMEGQVKLQAVISQLVLDLENKFYQLACRESSLAVILCDRGIMDGKAYCEEDVWEVLLEEKGWDIEGMRDNRYDAVLHMVSTAYGCMEKYSNCNNRVRFETIDQAKLVDNKLQEAWNKHPNFYILDNRYDFDHKINDAYKIVCKIIGLE